MAILSILFKKKARGGECYAELYRVGKSMRK